VVIGISFCTRDEAFLGLEHIGRLVVFLAWDDADDGTEAPNLPEGAFMHTIGQARSLVAPCHRGVGMVLCPA
jgi:hypothetical protein